MKPTFSRKQTLIPLAALLLLNLVFGYRAFCDEQRAGQTNEDATILQQLDMLINSLQLIRQNYVDGESVKTEDLLYGAINGLTSSLDPYSVFLPPQANQTMREESEGAFGGVGLSVGKAEDGLNVLAALATSPAAAAGVLPGDVIIAIDGESIAGLPLDEAVRKLRGEVGTTVTVTVRRADVETPLDFKVVRDRIPIATVTDTCLVPGTTIGYLRLLQFMEPSAGDVQKALQSLQEQGATALVLDLRGNPGGLLQTAVEICSFFLPNDQPIVSVEGRIAEKNYVCSAMSDYKFPDDIPLVILIDQGSASAAEITAGCLHDLKRAVLVGAKSFGKGSVQNVIELGNGCGLKLTVAKYYTPARQVIHGNGIVPDYAEPMGQDDYKALQGAGDFAARAPLDKQLQKALEVLGHAPQPAEENAEEPAEEPAEENAEENAEEPAEAAE